MVSSSDLWFETLHPDPSYRAYVKAQWLAQANASHNGAINLACQLTLKSFRKQWFQVSTSSNFPIDDQYRLLSLMEIQMPIEFANSDINVSHTLLLQRQLEELANLVQIAHQEIYIVNYENLHYLYANHKSLENIGYSLAELKQLTVYDTNPTIKPEHIAAMKAQQAFTQKISNLSVHKHKDGSTYPVKAIIHRISYMGQDAVVIFDTDITELIAAEEALIEQNTLLQEVINNAPVRIFWKDLQGCYLGANALFLKDAQLDKPEYILGKNDFEMPWAATQAEAYRADDLAVISSNCPKLHFEETQTNEQGYEIILQTSKVPLKDREGKVFGVLGTYEDVTERRQMENHLVTQKDRLFFQAHHDALTQLPNRVLLQDRLQHAIEKAKRHQTQFALFFIDLDQFKKINESLGHEVGDEVLKAIALKLQQCVRAEDTLARLGGDEFTVIMESIQQPQDVIRLAQNILDVTQEAIQIGRQIFYISSSIGISVYPKDAQTAQELLKFADAAMYRSKEQGRNNFQFYTADMTQQAFAHIAMQHNLRNSIHLQEFLVYFQPQIDTSTQQLVGMEALVRWQHPTLGMLAPDDFLPIAEETGLIVELDRLVMQKTFKQLFAWHQKGLNPGRVALNLTVKQLQQSDFIDFLESQLHVSGCQADWIELEITESGLMTNLQEMRVKLDSIKNLGVRIAIDDFGTGYSSLAYLKRLPVCKLKIDRSFITELPQDEEDAIITKTIIQMAKNLGLEVIAEGIETPEQSAFLLNNACPRQQGYLHSRPISAEAMTEYLMQRQKSKAE